MLNCWLHLRRHQWLGWNREDAWLNMYPYHGPELIGILANRCGRCRYMKLRKVMREQENSK